VVGRSTPRQPVRLQYAGESDRVRYSIPARPRIEGGLDRHLLLLDRDACRLYEHAAGLPILPGLARYDEVAGGGIDHALRFTAPRTRDAFVHPARHAASDSSDPALPPMGLRVRLKRAVPLAGLGPQARAVALALKRYGMILAHNDSPWYVTGAPDRRWDDDLHGASGASRGATSRPWTRRASPAVPADPTRPS
jgi:hypothetical protein